MQKENGSAEYVKKEKIKNAKMLLRLYYTGGKKSQNGIEGHSKSSVTDPKAVYYFTHCTTDYYKILEVGKNKTKLTLRLSKVLTVCAKSLILPGDAVPCALGPEDTCEPSMTSKPESKASEQLQ